MLSGINNLEGIIFLIVLSKIQRFCSDRNAFTGVVFELATSVVHRNRAVFGAEDLFISDLCSVDAVNTGTLDFFTKQHTYASFLVVFPALYIISPGFATVFLL